ncbi:hypothetical protein PPL_11656 [Heterostelium album PN500]|uniref:Protein kinase domain-containing protein n=1 Tax=Heterostelium pallidum (strain ATCC 26659 / Pp 5 / PN500) TaxID=670386 RepID=D3BVD0_HETP5|nr:hypothetical protein PPL_11656 [Heterostelium album PN500]EFA74687.1 hypothetical protein PPL_11656 [Heterostelium album PN500]|eukprot:XP_020426821.1 hypothetical protein PPL_11656 [Heterostelium album PN500]
MELFINNPRFVQLYDYQDDKDNQIFHIITKYCVSGDLAQEYKYLIDQNEIFKESEIYKYISQLFNILLDLDKHGIVHCDIKPSNIFIGDGRIDSTLMLGDFGCCKFIDKSTIIEYQDRKEHILDPPVMVSNTSNLKFIENEISEPTVTELSEPSIFDMESNTLIKATRGTIIFHLIILLTLFQLKEAMNRQYAQSCDIFSIGSTLLKLLCCHQDDRNNHQLFQSTGEIKISEFRYSKQLIEFIHRLLDQSPKNRESLNQLLNQYIETITNQHSITFNLNTTFYNTSEFVTEIKFGHDFNQPLESNSLPPNLTSLSFVIKFNQPIPNGVLPKSLKHLSFVWSFNQILEPGTLPSSLLSLKLLGNSFNQILSVGVLPESLELLEFGNRFNQILSVVGVFPESLESLKFGREFNQILSVGVLPEYLESLEVLPRSLEHFYLGSHEHIIDIVLPSSLKRLSLIFDQPPTNTGYGIVLPKPMELLSIDGYHKDSKKLYKLPPNLKMIEIKLGIRQTISAFQLTNSQDSLSFIKEFYPEYYSTHNLFNISDSTTDSQSNQIKGEYIIALLLT